MGVSFGAERAVERVLAEGSGIRAVLLYGESGAGMDRFGLRVCSEWSGVSEESVLRSVDVQKIEPWGKSRMLMMKLIRRDPVKRRDEDGETEVVEGKAKKGDWDGIPLLEFYRTRPLMSRLKVVWLHDAERMNSDVANALLKTIEEMPDHGRIVLTTSDLGRVLPTVRSRCLCVAVGSHLEKGDLTDYEAGFARTEGDLEEIRKCPEVFGELWSLLGRTRGAGIGEGLRMASGARSLASQLADETGENQRTAQAKVLDFVARWAILKCPERPIIAVCAVEGNRLVIGNGSASLIFDELFALIVAQNGEHGDY